MKKTTYRPEIDGLRAIAVLAVIIFHAGVEQLSGGFIGVDIFYVISGFLITAIIINSLEKKSFSYAGFYARRAKRLLPAALMMILVTVAFAAVILSPEKYYQLAKSAEFSTLFMANIWFMKHSGYFDLSTQISPLVHMWSLSIEEQFYFCYPFLLAVAYKFRKLQAIYLSIVFIIISTFLLNISLVNTYPNFTFYMLPTRAWELGIGALIHFLPPLRHKQANLASALSFTGFVAIFYSLFSISENDAYPGYLAAIPTLATAAIIYSLHHHNNLLKKLLVNKNLVFIGQISYSSYLWHWPIIVFYRIYINERAFNFTEIVALILISLLTGFLSWKYVENHFRYKEHTNKQVFNITGMAIAISVILIASVLVTRGFSDRVSEDLAKISNKKLMRSLPCVEQIKPFSAIDEQFCVIGVPWQSADKKGIVWGDSHSLHFGQLLHLLAKKQGVSLIIAPRKCPAYLNERYIKSHYPKYPNFNSHCTFRNQVTLNWLQDHHEVNLVILAASWSAQHRMHYTDQYLENKSNAKLNKKNPDIGASLSKVAFRALLAQLTDKKILLMGDIPRPNKNLNECAFSQETILLRQKCEPNQYKYLDAKTTLAWHKSSDQVIQKISQEYDNVTAIIPTELMCNKKHCQTFINKELIYRDDNHIRSNLSLQTAEIFAKKLTLTDFFATL